MNGTSHKPANNTHDTDTHARHRHRHAYARTQRARNANANAHASHASHATQNDRGIPHSSCHLFLLFCEFTFTKHLRSPFFTSSKNMPEPAAGNVRTLNGPTIRHIFRFLFGDDKVNDWTTGLIVSANATTTVCTHAHAPSRVVSFLPQWAHPHTVNLGGHGDIATREIWPDHVHPTMTTVDRQLREWWFHTLGDLPTSATPRHERRTVNRVVPLDRMLLGMRKSQTTEEPCKSRQQTEETLLTTRKGRVTKRMNYAEPSEDASSSSSKTTYTETLKRLGYTISLRRIEQLLGWLGAYPSDGSILRLEPDDFIRSVHVLSFGDRIFDDRIPYVFQAQVAEGPITDIPTDFLSRLHFLTALSGYIIKSSEVCTCDSAKNQYTWLGNGRKVQSSLCCACRPTVGGSLRMKKGFAQLRVLLNDGQRQFVCHTNLGGDDPVSTVHALLLAQTQNNKEWNVPEDINSWCLAVATQDGRSIVDLPKRDFMGEREVRELLDRIKKSLTSDLSWSFVLVFKRPHECCVTVEPRVRCINGTIRTFPTRFGVNRWESVTTIAPRGIVLARDDATMEECLDGDLSRLQKPLTWANVVEALHSPPSVFDTDEEMWHQLSAHVVKQSDVPFKWINGVQVFSDHNACERYKYLVSHGMLPHTNLTYTGRIDVYMMTAARGAPDFYSKEALHALCQKDPVFFGKLNMNGLCPYMKKGDPVLRTYKDVFEDGRRRVEELKKSGDRPARSALVDLDAFITQRHREDGNNPEQLERDRDVFRRQLRHAHDASRLTSTRVIVSRWPEMDGATWHRSDDDDATLVLYVPSSDVRVSPLEIPLPGLLGTVDWPQVHHLMRTFPTLQAYRDFQTHVCNVIDSKGTAAWFPYRRFVGRADFYFKPCLFLAQRHTKGMSYGTMHVHRCIPWTLRSDLGLRGEWNYWQSPAPSWNYWQKSTIAPLTYYTTPKATVAEAEAYWRVKEDLQYSPAHQIKDEIYLNITAEDVNDELEIVNVTKVNRLRHQFLNHIIKKEAEKRAVDLKRAAAMKAIDEQPDDPDVDGMCCTITGLPMVDPVQTSVGQTYERCAIERWLEGGHMTDPNTKQRITKTLTPNFNLKKMIAATWKNMKGAQPKRKSDTFEAGSKKKSKTTTLAASTAPGASLTTAIEILDDDEPPYYTM